MKLLITSGSFPPYKIGGAEIAAESVAREMAKNGIDTYVITRGLGSRSSHTRREGFWVYRVWSNERQFLAVHPLYNISYSISTILEAVKLRPDSILAFGIFPEGLLGVVLGKMLRRPCLVIATGGDIYRFPRWRKAVVEFTLAHCDLPIALTNHMRLVMKGIIHSNKEIAVLPNGMNPDDFKLDRSDCRAKLGIDQNQVVLLFLGRLEKVKGAEFLVKAMPSVLSHNPNIKLLIVGNGPERNSLESMCDVLGIRGHVEFVGQVQHSQVAKYFRASDLFILPSLSEGFGIVLIEAMYSGLPIIATDITGLDEIIKDGENGYLVKARNPIALSNKILELLGDSNKCSTMQTKNQEKAAQYSWQNITGRLLLLLQKAETSRGERSFGARLNDINDL